MPHVTVNDQQIFYDEVGAGVPMLLAHGGFSDISEWAPQVEPFSPHYRVIRYDRRGCGESSPKDVPHTPKLWVEDQRALIQALALDRPIIGGVSYGGMLLIEFLLKYPDLCRAAIIVSATAQGRNQGPVHFPDRTLELERIETPALVVQASSDHVFPPDHGEVIASGLPNGRLVVLDGGHTINDEQVEQFNEAVLSFLAEVV